MSYMAMEKSVIASVQSIVRDSVAGGLLYVRQRESFRDWI